MPSIFGFPTADELQQQRFSEAVRLHSAAAPGVAPAVMAGQGLSSGVASLLGGKDIQMERAQRAQDAQREVIESGLSPGDEGYVDTVRKAFAARGLFDYAQAAAQHGARIEKQILSNRESRQDIERKKLENEEAKELARFSRDKDPFSRIVSQLASAPEANSEYKKGLNIAAALMTKKVRKNLSLEQQAEMLQRIANKAVLLKATSGSLTTQNRNLLTNETQTIGTPDIPLSGLQSELPGGIPPQGIQSIPGQLPTNEMLGAAPSARGGLFNVDQSAEQLQPQPQQVSSQIIAQGVGPVDELNVDTAGDIAAKNNGSLVLRDSESLDAKVRRTGIDKSIIINRQKLAIGDGAQIGMINKMIRGQNELAKIIRENGPAHFNLINSWAQAMRQATQGEDNIVSSATKIGSTVLRLVGRDFQDAKSRLVIMKLNRAVQGMALTKKEVENLGALTGPDFQILKAIVNNPTDYLFRREGIKGFFDVASGATNDLLSSAHEIISNTGIQEGIPIAVPDSWYRLASRGDEVADISEQLQQGTITSDQAAKQMSNRLHFRVRQAGAEMLAGVGKYKPIGGVVKSVSDDIQKGLGAGVEAATSVFDQIGKGAAALFGREPLLGSRGALFNRAKENSTRQ